MLAGDALRLNFTFRCELCPQEYTTAGSHDPNGVWHDWLEDAVTFSVTICGAPPAWRTARTAQHRTI